MYGRQRRRAALFVFNCKYLSSLRDAGGMDNGVGSINRGGMRERVISVIIVWAEFLRLHWLFSPSYTRAEQI